MDLYLIDGHAIAYRAYYAFIRNPLVNSRGVNTSAVFGFLKVVLQLMESYDPDLLACVFDSGEKTDRHREFEDYKSQRKEMPEDMAEQLPIIYEVLEAMGLPVIIKSGSEADDVIATLAREAESRGMGVTIVTGDKDMMQLLSENVRMIRPGKGTNLTGLAGPELPVERYGIRPDQVAELLALMGDSSDNIPGVRGVGEKTAVALIKEFGSLESIYAKLEEVQPGHVRKKLADGRDDAFMSRDLVTLREVPLDIDIEELVPGERDDERLLDLLLDLEFSRIISDLGLGERRSSGKAAYSLVYLEGLEELAGRLARSKGFVLDVETTSLDPLKASLVGISFCAEEGKAWYVPVSSSGEEEGGLFGEESGEADRSVPLDEARRYLGPVLTDVKTAKTGHNIKYDLIVLENHGFEVRGVTWDTMIASYCLDPSRRSHSLDNLALEHLRHRMIPYGDLFEKGDRKRDIRRVRHERMRDYSCEDADMTLRLRTIFEPLLKSAGAEKLFHDVEMPLSFVLKRMEQEGIGIDTSRLGDISKEISAEVERLTASIHEKAGEPFNINSGKQLQHVLFDRLGLPPSRKTKTGYSTDVRVLTELAVEHPIAAEILEYRQLSKLSSTYVDALPGLVNERTGRIHSSFNQTVTSTGRLSSSDPNLQNIPIRTETGRRIRRAFVPREGNVFVDADYSQIELRILAHLSGDPELVAAFREEADIHTRTASRIYGVAEEEVDSGMRASAKTINFGVIYGQGPRALSQQLRIPFDEAKRFIDEYFEKYPGIKDFIERAKGEARERGYAETLLGRRRPLPDMASDDGRLRSFAERIAVNMPIQGTAADMIKIAMIRIDKRIEELQMGSRMVLQVHDELLFDVPSKEAGAMVRLVRDEMEGALELEVPVKVDTGTGRDWLEAH